MLSIAVLIAAMVSFQLGAVLAKSLFPVVGAPGATLLRVATGAIMLAAVLRPWRSRPSRRVLPALVLYGLALATMNSCFYMAIERIPLGVAIAIEFAGPLLVATLSSRRPADFAWIGLATAGILLLSPPVAITHRLDPDGVAFAFGAGACWAVYILVGQRAGRELGARATAFGMAIGAVPLVPIGIARAGATLADPRVLLIGAAVGLLSGALPYTLEMMALTRLSAQTYGTLTSLDPAIGALTALLFLGETLSGLQWAGIAAVMAAAVGAAITLRPTPAPPP